MKNYMSVILAGIILANTSITANAGLAVNYDVAVELSRKEKIDMFVKAIYDLKNRTVQYILNTGDITPTISEINLYYGITNPNIWSNYNNGILTVNLVNNSKIEIGNLFTSAPSKTVWELFATSPYQEQFKTIDKNAFKIYIPLDSTTFNFVKTVSELSSNPDVIISDTQPSDTSKIWYQPDGKGGFIVNKYNTSDSAWQNIGSTSIATSSGEGTNGSIVVKSLEELNSLPAATGMTAMVSDGTVAEPYVFDGEQWVKTASASNGGGLFNGTGTIEAMATTLFAKAGGSVVDTSAPNGEWTGIKTFTKKDDVTTGGYWIDDTKQFIVTSKISNLTALTNLFPVGTTAWISDNGNIRKLEKKTLPNGITAWVYMASDYSSVIPFATASESAYDGHYVYSTTHGEYFEKAGNVFIPVTPSNVYISTTDRSAFTTVVPDGVYLTVQNDCTDTTCYGDATNNYYAGAKIDNLYAFYYMTSGKQFNNLGDAKPFSNWNDFWVAGSAAILWQGSNFGDVATGTVLVKDKINGAIAYKTINGEYVNKASGLIIPQGKLPSGYTAETVTIVKDANGINRVLVNDLDDFATDTNLGTNYPVRLTGSGFTNKDITNCGLSANGNMVWSDNCSDIAHATVAITSGSRSDLPAPAGSSRINLTKNIGTEPNYTGTGVAYSADADWKQWFYSTSGTITNNMLDAYVTATPYTDATAKSIGYAVTNNKVGRYNVYGRGLWTLLTNSSKVLDKDFGLEFSITDVCGYASGANLLYDCGYNVMNWSSAKYTCNNKGWRLPVLSETTNYGSNKVPSYIGWTWTSTGGNGDYNIWDGSSYFYNYYDDVYYVRCVR